MDKPPRKIGVITQSRTYTDDEGQSRTDEVCEIKIYLINVDFDSNGIHEYTRVLPAVRFLFPYTTCFPAVCLANSTVYIFGGYYPARRYSAEAKSAHKFVLSPEVLAQPNYPVELGKKTQQLLEEISLMKYAKGAPEALPTPDGRKIIVFSCIITRKDCNRAFELYDTNGDYWEQLPPLPCLACNSPELRQFRRFPCSLCVDDEPLWAKTYSFLDESHFLIEFEMGAFALDLENRAWTALHVEIPRFEGYFVGVKGRYALFPGSAYDLGDGGYFAEDARERDGFGYSYEVPLSTFDRLNVPAWWDEEEEWKPLSCIVPLRPVVENGVCSTCVVQLDGQANDGRVLIDVCRTELSTLKTTVSNCVRLCLDSIEYYSDISLVSV